MTILYTDFDEKTCKWLEQLVSNGLLPEGEVWCRDIDTITPDEVAHFTQRHWFCGIGGWPYALQLAKWPTNRPCDTASLPCQPWSAAWKGNRHNDDRHIWPIFYKLVKQLLPTVIMGEQVCSADVVGYASQETQRETPVWFDGICDDLEKSHYSVGAVDLPAASVGAPHIRQRLFWVANSQSTGRSLEHAKDERETAREINTPPNSSQICRPNFWSNAQFIPCADGKARRVSLEPAFQPLSDGLPDRVAILHGLGNAIVPQVAAEFIQAFMETTTNHS